MCKYGAALCVRACAVEVQELTFVFSALASEISPPPMLTGTSAPSSVVTRASRTWPWKEVIRNTCFPYCVGSCFTQSVTCNISGTSRQHRDSTAREDSCHAPIRQFCINWGGAGGGRESLILIRNSTVSRRGKSCWRTTGIRMSRGSHRRTRSYRKLYYYCPGQSGSVARASARALISAWFHQGHVPRLQGPCVEGNQYMFLPLNLPPSLAQSLKTRHHVTKEVSTNFKESTSKRKCSLTTIQANIGIF